MIATDGMQLAALRFLLWHTAQVALNGGKTTKRTSNTKSMHTSMPRQTSALSNAESLWVDLDRCETALRWAARIRLTLVQRSVGEALGRLQAMAGEPLVSLHGVRMRQAIEISLESVCAVLDQFMRAAAGDRPIRLGSLAAAFAEKTAVKHWKSRARPLPNERAELSPGLQSQCVPWLRVAPLRDDLSQVDAAPSVGGDVLSLRYGWKGMTPHTMNDAARLLGIHPRRAAFMGADAFRKLVRTSAR